MTSFKRKQFWIDSPLQLHILGYVLVLVTVSLSLLSYSVMHGITEAAAAEARMFFFSLDWVRNAIRAPMILASCLSILASGVATLLWSHRFAGPLRVLSAAMGRLRQGDLSTPVRIRKTDTHQELIAEFAQMQEDLRELIKKDRHKAHEAVKKLEHILKASSHPPKDLEHLIDELKTIGGGFQL
ncbi:MAG: HAMP domain-containing protein [Elusimicrobia bacterium]|nr:HAMP domain-containing protein [Elusimicrobiota bacterium]